MFTASFQAPRFTRWQMRLARLPRWAWIAFFIGAVIPIVIMLAVAIAAGLLVLAAALVVGAGLGLIYRLLHRRPRRPSNEIVVRSVRIVDP